MTHIEEAHRITWDSEAWCWACSCPTGSVCPLTALYAADSAFRAMRRSQIVMDDMWSAEMAEAGEMVGVFLWPLAGVDDEDRRMFAASTQAAGSTGSSATRTPRTAS